MQRFVRLRAGLSRRLNAGPQRVLPSIPNPLQRCLTTFQAHFTPALPQSNPNPTLQPIKPGMQAMGL